MVMQIRPYLLTFGTILFVAVFMIFTETQAVFAQGFPNYGTNSTLSPWLGLTNRPTGSLDAYNQYVRPRLDMQRTFEQQQSQIIFQGRTQQEMLRNFGSGSGIQAGTQGGVQTTGRVSQPATFRNYSHYYNFRR